MAVSQPNSGFGWFRILILVFLSLQCCTTTAKSSSTAISQLQSPKLASNNLTLTPDRVIQLYETEVYNGRAWKAPDQSRWTNSEGQVVPPPDQWRETWTSEWKIVTGDECDEFGWAYELARQRSPGSWPMRRRIWLRTCSSSVVACRPHRLLRPISAAFQALCDDFNFKGWGWTFYKGLFALDSCGVALRLPMTYNFELCNSHPAWPSISSSIAFYYPNPTLVVFLNASLRMEWIQWMANMVASTIVYTVAWFVWTLVVRGWLVAASALAFPVTGRLVNLGLPMERPLWRRGPDYSRTMEERLGVSWSVRVSVNNGYEYRQSYWHYYAPTVVSILEALDALPLERIPTWLVRRAAAVGLSTSGLTPDQPYVTSSAILSLSGYYFQKEGRETPILKTSVTNVELDSLTVPAPPSHRAQSSSSSSSSTTGVVKKRKVLATASTKATKIDETVEEDKEL